LLLAPRRLDQLRHQPRQGGTSDQPA
jgi:hypothetical protein